MVNLRPHILKWNAPGTPAGETPEGYPIPGTPGEEVEQPCRFHSDRSKMLKNEDSTEILQVGKIRLSKGDAVPHLWASVLVVDEAGNEVYSGTVKNRFVGQLSGGWVEV
ncbi:MAG: hypothetical protein EOO88_48235 [Pedobacter sp.]|nr:MAG: hypothetical protein EOO88_48235 [Pedobacter sp.]